MAEQSTASDVKSACSCPPWAAHIADTAPTSSDLARKLLPGMVARGHGIEALCAYLGLARIALLDLVVALDLPTPHDRAPRKPGRFGWSLADATLLVTLWMAGWHVDSLAAHFGRSRSGVWSKGRRLGLPRRDRKLVFKLVLAATRDTSAESAAAGPPFTDADTEPDSSIARSGMDLPVAPAAPQFDLFRPASAEPARPAKAPRREVTWTFALDMELSNRWWARQHYRAIARDMGISPPAIQSRRRRLELPTTKQSAELGIFHRDELVDHYDPSVVEENIALAGYVLRRCSKLGPINGLHFWTKNSGKGHRTSDEAKRLDERAGHRVSTAKPRRSVPKLGELAMPAWMRQAGVPAPPRLAV